MVKVDKESFRFNLISKIYIDNGKGLKLILSSFGASIYECYLNDIKITEAPDYKTFLYSKCYYGKTVGRSAGRIRNGIIKIDNKTYRLSKGKTHSLHGGNGFSFKNYKYSIEEDDKAIKVKFILISRDFDNGYPGHLVNIVIYRISKEKNEFTIEFKAKSNKNTICNLTNHAYWNLNGDRKEIFDHKLYIDADEYVKIDGELLKISIDEVNDTFDYRKIKLIKEHIFDECIQNVAKGYDHDWILNESGLDKPKLILIGDKSKIKLKLYTSNPVCHIYTNNYAKPTEKFNSMAIEMQKRVFDVAEGAILLKKNDDYYEMIRYVFEEDY